jgi:hypothetical protein
MTSSLGMGLSAFGSSRMGFGTPGTINSTVAKLFLKELDQSVRGNAEAINPVTGDYVRDTTTGIHRGMDSVQQMVYLALRTVKNSTLVPNFGLRNFGEVITDSTRNDIINAVNETLRDLVLRQLIEIVSIEVTRVKAIAYQILVKWRNITNNETNVFRISL